MRRTRVEDPISGDTRNFSDFFPDWEWNFDVRRDAGAWSYGFVLSDRDRFTFFRTDEFDINYNDAPFATAFVEYRPGPRTSITLDLDNVLNGHGQRTRLIFDPNRGQPEDIVETSSASATGLEPGPDDQRSFGGGGVARQLTRLRNPAFH